MLILMFKKKKKKMKKGLELSINVLIVVILSIVLLFLGIAFFRNLLTGAHKIKESYDQRTADELENLLIQGEKVAIPFPRQDVKRHDTTIFGLGIYNALGHNSNFKVNVQCSTAFQEKTELPTACNTFVSGDGKIVYNTNDIPIKNNEMHKMPIAIYFPKDAAIATYVFNVCVCKDDLTPVSCTDCGPSFPANLYDSVHKIYATVK